MTLEDLPDGSPSRVRRLYGDPLLRERLAELGFTPGSQVEIRSRAPFGATIQVRVRGGVSAVRGHEARCVDVTAAEGALPGRGGRAARAAVA